MPRCKPIDSKFDASIPWGDDGPFEFEFEMVAEMELLFQQAMRGIDGWENAEMWPVILGSLKGWNVEGPNGGPVAVSAENFMRYVPRVIRTVLPRFFVAAALHGRQELPSGATDSAPELTEAEDLPTDSDSPST